MENKSFFCFWFLFVHVDAHADDGNLLKIPKMVNIFIWFVAIFFFWFFNFVADFVFSFVFGCTMKSQIHDDNNIIVRKK